MDQVKIKAEVRTEQGTGAVRRLRRQGLVPGSVMKMDKSGVELIKFSKHEFMMAMRGHTSKQLLVTLEMEGRDVPALMRNSSVGRCMPTLEAKIENPDEDGIGELFAKGPNIMKGYLDDPEADKEVFVNGWFNTGDLARIDKDGYIFLTGRKKNVIVLKNGKNIYPEEIEALIDKIPYVVEDVVMGEEEGDDYRLVAHVVYDPEAEELKGKSIEEIQAIADADIEKINDEMPKYKRVKQTYLRTEPFEKTTTQKIKRRKIK